MIDEPNLERFKKAQDLVYHRVLNELGAGKKVGHWMWFIFPQIIGLGSSVIARQYAIKSRQEAEAFLKDTLLGGRLKECCQLLLSLESGDITKTLGYPDNMKLQSSMTLFAVVAQKTDIFQKVLDKFYDGKIDAVTLAKIQVDKIQVDSIDR